MPLGIQRRIRGKKAKFGRECIDYDFLIQDPLYAPLVSAHMDVLGVKEVGGQYFRPPHCHGTAEIIFPLTGVYHCLLNDVRLDIPPGQALFVAPGDWHEDRVEGGTGFLAAVFNLYDTARQTKITNLLPDDLPAKARIFTVDPLFGLDWIVPRLMVGSPNPVFGNHEISALGASLVWRSLVIMEKRLAKDLTKLIRENAFNQNVMHYFMGHAGESFDAADMAQTLDISRRTLEYKCQAIFGASPRRAFMNYKINRAKQMLKSGMRSKEVFRSLGFANAYHFSRTFKAETGQTVSEFLR